MTTKININEKFSKFSEHWRPKIVAELNGQEFKLAKIKGEYPFHAHEGEDEMFFCWKGSFVLDFQDGESVHVGEGEAIVVPKGAECSQTVRGTDCNEAPESLAIQDNPEGRKIKSVLVKEDECIVAPKGLIHRPRAEEECHIFLIEPKDVKNNGDAEVEAKYDAPMGEWV